MSDPAPKPLHVVLLNQAFHPDVVATAQMGKDLADFLVRRGHRVTAVASRSIYGRRGASLPAREEIPVEGGVVSARRVGFSLFGKSSIAARLVDFALFYLLAAWRVLTLPRPDVVVAYTTPPFIAAVALLARALRGARAVHWVMDLYPDLPIACGVMKPRSIPARLASRVALAILRAADTNVVLGRCMKERLVSQGVPESKLHLIPVWADLQGIEPVPHDSNPLRRAWAPAGEFLVMYSGNFGLGHDAATIIGALRQLKDDPTIRFAFVGGGKRRREVEDAAREHGITNIIFEDYRPRAELSNSLSAADLHLISLKEGVEGIMVPSKLFGIMAVARPSVFVGSPASEIARVLAESHAGLTVRERDSDALARAIRDLRNDPARARAMGQSARRAVAGAYDAQSACAQWARLLESLAHSP